MLETCYANAYVCYKMPIQYISYCNGSPGTAKPSTPAQPNSSAITDNAEPSYDNIIPGALVKLPYAQRFPDNNNERPTLSKKRKRRENRKAEKMTMYTSSIPSSNNDHSKNNAASNIMERLFNYDNYPHRGGERSHNASNRIPRTNANFDRQHSTNETHNNRNTRNNAGFRKQTNTTNRCEQLNGHSECNGISSYGRHNRNHQNQVRNGNDRNPRNVIHNKKENRNMENEGNHKIKHKELQKPVRVMQRRSQAKRQEMHFPENKSYLSRVQDNTHHATNGQEEFDELTTFASSCCLHADDGPIDNNHYTHSCCCHTKPTQANTFIGKENFQEQPSMDSNKQCPYISKHNVSDEMSFETHGMMDYVSNVPSFTNGYNDFNPIYTTLNGDSCSAGAGEQTLNDFGDCCISNANNQHSEEVFNTGIDQWEDFESNQCNSFRWKAKISEIEDDLTKTGYIEKVNDQSADFHHKDMINDHSFYDIEHRPYHIRTISLGSNNTCEFLENGELQTVFFRNGNQNNNKNNDDESNELSIVSDTIRKAETEETMDSGYSNSHSPVSLSFDHVLEPIPQSTNTQVSHSISLDSSDTVVQLPFNQNDGGIKEQNRTGHMVEHSVPMNSDPLAIPAGVNEDPLITSTRANPTGLTLIERQYKCSLTNLLPKDDVVSNSYIDCSLSPYRSSGPHFMFALPTHPKAVTVHQVVDESVLNCWYDCCDVAARLVFSVASHCEFRNQSNAAARLLPRYLSPPSTSSCCCRCSQPSRYHNRSPLRNGNRMPTPTANVSTLHRRQQHGSFAIPQPSARRLNITYRQCAITDDRIVRYLVLYFVSPHKFESNLKGSQCQQPLDSDQLTYNFLFPSDKCGRLIGRSGNNIGALRERSGSNIVVQKDILPSHEQIVSITGSRARILQTLQMISGRFMEPVNISAFSMEEHYEQVKPVLYTPIPVQHVNLQAGIWNKVRVCSVLSTTRYFVHSLASSIEFCRFRKAMDDVYNGVVVHDGKSVPIASPLAIGLYCVAPISGGRWARAIVRTFNPNDCTAMVFLPDFGTNRHVFSGALKTMHHDFAFVPPFAIEVILDGCQPKPCTSSIPDMLEMTIKYFEEKVIDLELLYSPPIGPQVCDGYVDDESGLRIMVKEEMIAMNLVARAASIRDVYQANLSSCQSFTTQSQLMNIIPAAHPTNFINLPQTYQFVTPVVPLVDSNGQPIATSAYPITDHHPTPIITNPNLIQSTTHPSYLPIYPSHNHVV